MTESERVDAETTADGPDPSEAFAPLGNEVRTRTLAALLDDGVPTRRRFSELFEASGADTSAGFAYHLRQLTGHYLRETDEGYALTDAGVRMARAIASGTYTESVDREPVPVADPCPFCGAGGDGAAADGEDGEAAGDGPGLRAGAHDNTVAITCSACEQTVLSLGFPPGGFRSHDDDALPRALDSLYRHRVGLLADGTCPECGGASRGRIEYTDETDTGDDQGDGTPLTRIDLSCSACGYALRCPVTLAVLDHPAVVSFYHDHGVDLRDRPIWNVGEEWAERVLSDDPWCVRVATTLDAETLSVLVGADGTVVETDRQTQSAS
ncbi:ArsR family transcriptional regulator [Halomarina salina]|uniref:ArsR family transcriptional regulator n=1 Tax=Halomarina salina TaxID=1872699 RepID=A0ABD5RLJ1_9EURY|nr:ArsR family transcriptional regulator [Halomarina salina]